MTTSYLQILVYVLLLFGSCDGQKNKDVYNPKAIQLNNKAIEFLKTQQYDSALTYLDKSIKIDTSYYLAYGNKSTVYCTLKDFKEALIVTEKEIEVKPDLAEGWTFAGMLNDKLGDTLNAVKYYKRSIEIYNERILNPDKQKYLKANEINRALSYVLMGQEQIGINEIKKLRELYPSDTFLDDFLKINKRLHNKSHLCKPGRTANNELWQMFQRKCQHELSEF